ncbi:MAG: ribosome-associated heat shock protein Hsp15 [Ketobacteraceae bacterium]|nr:ribosome-associated heat shock protein Hsp15 [Ketobacteraceae bacterium]
MSNQKPQDKVRIDKWLWAARFYKTRSLAKEMVEGGKVHYNGQRVKPSKEVSLGGSIRLRQGFDEKTVVITGISDKRGNATMAASLYEETPESVAQREANAARRKHLASSHPVPEGRPNKRDRRKIIQFQQKQDN